MFTHLHVHSHYSLLDSTVKIGDLVSRVSELGMGAVAVTDHGNMFAAIEFQKKALGKGIQPIFGVELYVIPEQTAPNDRTRPHHLVVLAESLVGYKNMVRMVSRAWLRGPDRDGRPLTNYADLLEFSEGLIALSGDMGGEIAQCILRDEPERAEQIAARYLEVFGEDNFFLEVQRHEGIPESRDVCDAMVGIGARLSIPLVATNNVHYLSAGDVEAHAILMCIGMDKRIERSVLDKIPLRDLHLRSPEEMMHMFSDLPVAVENTALIAKRCNVTIPTGTSFLPAYKVPAGTTEAEFLRQCTRNGLDRRYAEFDALKKSYDRQEYEDRVTVELDIIEQMGFPGYFLIVWDFIAWAKNNDVPVGPGRGSGAGSLVAYSLQITDIDPLPYGLLFERFLNPERVSMPDFDIDFCQHRRVKVIDYVTQKYGQHNVAQIVTFGQLKAKAVVRDVARVLNLPFAEASRLAKMVPDELGIKLAEAYDKEPNLRQAIAEEPIVDYLYNIGLALEHNNRNSGIHAAGIVMSEEPIWEYVPVMTGANGELITQYAKDEVEAAGLVKFDFLGLKTLSVIDEAVRLINMKRPDDPLKFNVISLDEPDVYKLIQSGDTTGVFQMESDGFQRLMRQLRPDCFEDIVAAVALYRPGPLNSGMVEQFIDCKHGRRQVEYPHPWLEDVLRDTYGVMVYQEQVMKVAQVLAGYTLGGADLLRRAMGKKKASEMDRQRKIFVEGASGKGVPEAKANSVFDLMAHFAGYGFNKSHSAAYAVLTFQTAYLKTQHPSEFYAALMTSDSNKTEKVVRFIADARDRNIRVLPPDVNASGDSFSVADAAVRFGLGAIKGLGSGPIEAIVEARNVTEFTSLYDFCDRVDLSKVSKRVLEALIRSGSFDSIYPDAAECSDPNLTIIGRWRARLLAAMEVAVERGQKTQADKKAGQASLFGMFAAVAPQDTVAEHYPSVPGWGDKMVLVAEKETLGFYVSGHPLDRYADEINLYTDVTSDSLGNRNDREQVRYAGIITSRRERPTKNGEGRMAFLQVEDRLGEIEVVVFSRVHALVAEALDSDDPILVTGAIRVDDMGEDRTRKIIASGIEPLWRARSQHVKAVEFELNSEELDDAFVTEFDAMLARHPGGCSVSMRVDFGRAVSHFRLPKVSVAATDELMNESMSLFGEKRIRFR